MVVTAAHLSHDRAEMTILDINEELQVQQAESQQQFEDLKEKFLIIQATARKMKKYKCAEEKDIDSVLRDELQFIEEKLAEKFGQAEELRQYKALVRCQAKELTQLLEEREASRSLNQHLKALLTPDDPAKSQGQDLREQLAEGHRLAECFNKLSLESDEHDDEDITDAEVEKVQESPDHSSSPSDSNQPHGSTEVTFEGDEVDSAMIIDGEWSQNEDEEMPYFLPESDEHDDEDITDAEVEKVQESPDHSSSPSDSNQPHGSTEVTFEGDEVDSAMIIDGEWSQNEDEEMPYFLPESDEHDDEDITDAEVEKVQESPDHSSSPSDSNQPHGSTEVTFEGDEVDSAMIIDGEWSQNEDEEMPYFLPESDEHDDEDITDAEVEKVQESPDHSSSPSDSNQPHGSTEVTFEGDEVDSAMIIDGEWSQNEDEEMPYFLPESDEHDDEDITDAEVEKVQESPDHSSSPSDSNQPHGSTEVTFEGDEVDSAMIIDGEWSQNEDEEMPYFLPAPTQETRPQGTCSGDVSYYLSEMETSLTQPEPSTLVPNCLGLQLDQGFDCENGLAMQGPSSTTCSFTANADSGTQCSFQEMVAQPSGWLKSPPQREDDPSQHSADNTRGQRLIGNIHTSSVFKPKMIKRESRFSKWNPYPSHLGCRGTKYYQKAAKAETMPIKQLFQLMRKN
ncbi:neuroblastoma breakpoint family member 4-like [Aotus nancymaae]|uniref:neuroblastoma breakpoint family member 4-like n=1 Tax=Aotus nancymaae TaxID=37293 RepID=UPI0030FE1079